MNAHVTMVGVPLNRVSSTQPGLGGAAVAAPPSTDTARISSPQPGYQVLWNGIPRPVPLGTDGLAMGRSSSNGLVMRDTSVSRQHALLAEREGKLWLMDNQSTRGTYLNGKEVKKGEWLQVGAGDLIRLGPHESNTLQVWCSPTAPQEIALPDGRSAVVERLRDGRLRLSKVDYSLAPQDFPAAKFVSLSRGMKDPASPADLKIGEVYRGRFDDEMRHSRNYLGPDAQGRLRFGHTDEYSPEEYVQYLSAQQRRVNDDKAAALQRVVDRALQANKVRLGEMRRLGLTQQDLQNAPAAAAKILAGKGLLAADGRDIWPTDVHNQVVAAKTRQLEADPKLTSRGLVPVRLQEWLADQRGEFVLYRGVGGEYRKEPRGHYTNDVLCALGYSLEHGGGDVVALRIPRSDIPRFYVHVGGLPGRNTWAEVYDVRYKKLDDPRQPALMLRTSMPQQRWIVNGLEANKQIRNFEPGIDDYNRLLHSITGK